MGEDEGDRHRLHTALQSNLGAKEAATLMALLPPVGWADVATRRDLDMLRVGMEARFEGMEARFGGIEAQFTLLEGRLRQEMATQTRTIVFAMIGTMLALATFVLAIAAFG